MKSISNILLFIIILCSCSEEYIKPIEEIIRETTPSIVEISFELDESKLNQLEVDKIDDYIFNEMKIILEEFPNYDIYIALKNVLKNFGGSGFVITKDGEILTCAHVVKVVTGLPGSLYARFYTGAKYKLTNIQRNDKTDVAKAKIVSKNIKFKPLKLEFNRFPRRGEQIISFGSSSPILFGFVEGRVVWTITEFESPNKKKRYTLIPIEGNIIPGFSGGPSVNMYGKVIGINKSYHIHKSFSFLITVSDIGESNIEFIKQNTK